MARRSVRLTDAQWAKIAPHLPRLPTFIGMPSQPDLWNASLRAELSEFRRRPFRMIHRQRNAVGQW